MTFTDAFILDMVADYLSANQVTLRLFTNTYTPTDLSTVGELTEASGGTYSAKVLSVESWTASIVEGIVTAVYPLQDFDMSAALTGGATVKGYYLTTPDLLVGAFALETPFTPNVTGTIYSVVPRIRFSNGVVTK